MSQALKNPPVYFTLAQVKFNPLLSLEEHIGSIQEKFRVANFPDYQEQQNVTIQVTIGTDGQQMPVQAVQKSFVYEAAFVGLMESIQTGFERVMSHLPAVFGVSRQTLYNWLNGEVPKEKHQEKIRQLAKAALVFTNAGFKPTSTMLVRTVANGQSFIDLLKHNADGASSAKKLMRIVNGGAQEREKLDQILGNRKLKPLNALDIGRPSFNESV